MSISFIIFSRLKVKKETGKILNQLLWNVLAITSHWCFLANSTIWGVQAMVSPRDLDSSDILTVLPFKLNLWTILSFILITQVNTR